MKEPSEKREEPCPLTPPLRLVWSRPNAIAGQLIASDGIFVPGNKVEKWGFAKLDFEGKVLWQFREGFTDAGWICHGDKLLCAMDPSEEALKQWFEFDAATGAVLRQDDGPFSLNALLPDGKSYLGTTILFPAFETKIRKVARVSLAPGLPVIWELESPSPSTMSYSPGYDTELAYEDGRVFVRRGDQLLGLDAETGAELWRASIAHIKPVNGGDILAEQGRVALGGGEGGALFDARTGAEIRSWRGVPAFAVHGDRLYLLSRHYTKMRLDTGEILAQCDMKANLVTQGKLKQAEQLTSPAVSDTHIFFGDMLGYLWAADRETGDIVWKHRPPKVVGFWTTRPEIHHGRLYITSYSADPKRPPYLYCYEAKNR